MSAPSMLWPAAWTYLVGFAYYICTRRRPMTSKEWISAFLDFLRRRY